MRARPILLSTLLIALAIVAGAGTAHGQETSCTTCHQDADLIDDPAMLEIVQHFQSDVHTTAGLSCHDCHGGNPDPALADDMFGAMDPDYAPHPFVGKPERTAIPKLCGSCHSDPNFMKRFRPDIRVDQLAEYWTSQHGKALRAGDTKVATCVDCHGVHGIRQANDPQSSVYPSKVASTCNGCHGDPEHMAGYTLVNGDPLPVDQFVRWKRSVHGQALLEREDLFAPTCNDCHGNHGAAPPGLDSVAFVCGQCHGREATLFRSSAKHRGWQDHNEQFLAGGDVVCGDCHEGPEPQAKVSRHQFIECATCHGNHSIIRPTVAILTPLPQTPCALCHESSADLAAAFPEPEKAREHYQELKGELLAQAEEQGLKGNELFDWLVDQAQALPTHTVEAQDPNAEVPELRPEFARLFQKFRIGKTSFTFPDPVTGEPVKETITRCGTCHGTEPAMTDRPVGYETAQSFIQHMQELTVLTARAERMVLQARRGGVEVRNVLLPAAEGEESDRFVDAETELDHAVDAQIELEVMVHAFNTGGPFAEKQKEGIGHAEDAILAANEALKELTYRRRGLAVSAVLVLLVALALALKIRQISVGD